MPQIFISHSRRDTDLLGFFDSIFARRDVSGKAVEYEIDFPNEMQPADYIFNEISKSEALFAVLGPNVDYSDYTSNWIGFEIGIAMSLKKDIWVFEPLGSTIHFPVPYLQHFVLYDLNEANHRDYITKIVEQYQFLLRRRRVFPDVAQVTCSYESCRSQYKMYTEIDNFSCPTCRRLLPPPAQGALAIF